MIVFISSQLVITWKVKWNDLEGWVSFDAVGHGEEVAVTVEVRVLQGSAPSGQEQTPP